MNFSSYSSPFSWRYASKEMRYLFSEEYKYQLWRKIWIALATAEHKAGLVSTKELQDLKKQQHKIDIQRIVAIEKETKHDVVAAIREFAEKAKIGGGKIHLGATSMDIVDNADMLRMREAMDLVEKKLKTILVLFTEKIDCYAEMSCMGFTHLQPAEPVTVGYRLSFYAQDLLVDLQNLQFVKQILKGKGMKGAVGTGASYVSLLKETKVEYSSFEKQIMQILGIDASLISSQTYTRKFDYLVLSCLNSIASSLAKFAGDVRILQSPMFGEWSEPFEKKQIGSSAMPFKKNPVNSEKICSLARYVNQLPSVGLENATLSYLERTLDDSANKRIAIPNAFLAVDEILLTAQKIISGLVINEKRIVYNLSQFAPFAATESILLAAVKKGANRQNMHEVLRDIAMVAWNEIQQGHENPMKQLLLQNEIVKKYLTKEYLLECFLVTDHTGDAAKRAKKLIKEIQKKEKKGYETRNA